MCCSRLFSTSTSNSLKFLLEQIDFLERREVILANVKQIVEGNVVAWANQQRAEGKYYMTTYSMAELQKMSLSELESAIGAMGSKYRETGIAMIKADHMYSSNKNSMLNGVTATGARLVRYSGEIGDVVDNITDWTDKETYATNQALLLSNNIAKSREEAEFYATALGQHTKKLEETYSLEKVRAEHFPKMTDAEFRWGFGLGLIVEKQQELINTGQTLWQTEQNLAVEKEAYIKSLEDAALLEEKQAEWKKEYLASQKEEEAVQTVANQTLEEKIRKQVEANTIGLLLTETEMDFIVQQELKLLALADDKKAMEAYIQYNKDGAETLGHLTEEEEKLGAVQTAKNQSRLEAIESEIPLIYGLTEAERNYMAEQLLGIEQDETKQANIDAFAALYPAEAEALGLITSAQIELNEAEEEALAIGEMKKEMILDSLTIGEQLLSLNHKNAKAIGKIQTARALVEAYYATQLSFSRANDNPAATLNPAYPYVIAAATLAKGLANAAAIRSKTAAEGMNEVVTEPTLILAGEAGAEYVDIEPLTNEGAGRKGGVNITFSGNVMSQDFIENEAIPKIKEAIRKGGDIGIG